MDPRMVPKGSGPEYNYDENTGGAGHSNDPGVYYHPQAQKFIESSRVQTPDGSVAYHPEQGKIQADAFVQFGFRPASKEELKEYRAKQAEVAEAQRQKDTATTTVMSDSSKK